MKKIIFLLLISISLISSCKKEYSYEKTCGTVWEKGVDAQNRTYLAVLYKNGFGGAYTVRKVNDALYTTLEIGDQYCK